MKNIPDNSVDLIITSPPYNKGFYDKHKPHKSDVWKQRNIVYGEYKDNRMPEEYVKWQKDCLNEMVRILKLKGSIFYNIKPIIANHKLVFPTFVFDYNVRQQIIWNRKSTPQLAPIRFFPTTELIFWITKTNIQPFYQRSNLLFDKEVWELSPRQDKEHPATFPIKLPTNCILATTKENDVVLDCFMGSGTTGIACKNLNRNFIGIELDETYFNIAKERIENTVIQESLILNEGDK